MFGLDPVYLALGAAVFALLEVALFWAAASLGDAPELGWGKTFLVAVGVAAIWAAVVGVTGWQAGLNQAPLAPDNRPTAAVVAAIGLAVMWAVPAILYAPLVPATVSRSMLIALFQVLLRAFLYVLIVAVVMVVLALMQIWSGTDVRAALPPGLGIPPLT